MRLDKRHFLPPCHRRRRPRSFTRSQVVIVIAIERREGEGGIAKGFGKTDKQQKVKDSDV